MLREEVRAARLKIIEMMFTMASIIVAILGLFEVVFAPTISPYSLLTFIANIALYFGFFAIASFSLYLIESFRLSNQIIRGIHYVSTYVCFLFFAVIFSAIFVFGLLVNNILPLNSAGIDLIFIFPFALVFGGVGVYLFERREH